MRSNLPAAAVFFLTATLTQAGSFGPGPWSSGAYYPGGADGKYQAAVYGNNITGVIGFAIREGSPTVLQQTNAQSQQNQNQDSAAAATVQAATTAAQVFDATQNYFVIFVEGRTYSGLAVGSVNPVGKTVTGSLLGAQPDFGFVTNTLPFEFPDPVFRTNTNVTIAGTNLVVTTNSAVTNINITNIITTNFVVTNVGPVFITNIVYSTNIVTNIVIVDPERVTNEVPIFITNVTEVNDSTFFSVSGGTGTTNSFDPLPILNRGLSGGFQAKIKNNKAFMTFRGSGELSTPAQLQTVDLATNAAGNNVAGTIETETIPFNVDGLRTSFLTTFAPALPSATTGQ